MKYWLHILVFTLVLVFCLYFFVPGMANALGLSTPFGGRILTIVPCLASPDIGLWVGPPKPGFYIYRLGFSKLYRFFSLTPGAWVLGTASGVDTCDFIPGQVIQIMGTSGL